VFAILGEASASSPSNYTVSGKKGAAIFLPLTLPNAD